MPPPPDAVPPPPEPAPPVQAAAPTPVPSVPSPDDVLPPPPTEGPLTGEDDILGDERESTLEAQTEDYQQDEQLGTLPEEAGHLPEETGEVFPVHTGDIEIEPADELEEIEEEVRDPHKPPPPPPMSKAGKRVQARGVCDICGGEPVWYPEQQRWYCEHCKHFL